MERRLTTPLSIKMRAAADAECFPADHELRVAADKLDAAADWQSIPKTVAAWARARKAWCAYSGEELI